MSVWSLGTARFLSQRDWESLRMLLPFFLEFKGRFAFALLCLGLIQLAGLSGPLLLGFIVDGMNPEVTLPIAIPLGWLSAYVFVRFLSIALAELRNAVFGQVTVRATRRLSLKLLDHLHNLDLEYHVSRKTGAISRDMDRGINAITSLIRLFTFSILSMVLSIGGVIGIFLAFFDWRYSVIVLVSTIVYAVYTVKVTAWRTPFIRQSNDAHSRAHTRAIDSLINHETVKYFGNEEAENTLYDEELHVWEKARARNRYSLAALNIGQSFVVNIGMFGMLLLACFGIVSGELSLGQFVAINGYAMQVFMPLGALGGIYRQLKQAFTDVENMFNILEESPKIVNTSLPQVLPPGDGPIEFRNVSFSYRPERPIIRDISFTIQPGEKVALVGPSGGGKSTIARLLFRFYDPTEGSIRINGTDIRNVDLDRLRSQFGVVPQDTSLFNDTLFSNIAYGRTDATEDDVENAARMAHLDELLSNLPDGFDTVVGERGLKLSGGEKQRVAIARTMLKKPTFLVFDEATSSLDSSTEASIMTAIEEVSARRTTLIIAHRLCTVVHADRIIVLSDGRIAESGSHEELLDFNGIYARLWRLQHRQIEQLEYIRMFSDTA